MNGDRRERVEPLIGELVAGLRPVKPIRYAKLLAICLFGGLVAGAAAAALAGVRPDLLTRVAEPSYLLILGLLAFGSAACLAAALRTAIPGREPSPRTAGSMLAVPVVLAVGVLLVAPWGGVWPGLVEVFAGCWRCIGLTAAGALAPWILTFVVLRGLAPLSDLRVALYAAFGAFLLGGLVTELHCPATNRYHLALFHYLPVVLFSSAACVMTVWLLRRLPSERSI